MLVVCHIDCHLFRSALSLHLEIAPALYGDIVMNFHYSAIVAFSNGSGLEVNEERYSESEILDQSSVRIVGVLAIRHKTAIYHLAPILKDILSDLLGSLAVTTEVQDLPDSYHT